ncbi:hypothetical protein, partial [Solemya velum gill symbiont]|uniref:hypothetical protein n=1 Tax=Solemya velum gill symbiont TaxID=2340 RepID=UPI001E57F8F6
FLDDFFRFVSLDSHFWSSVFLIIRVDQLIGGGSLTRRLVRRNIIYGWAKFFLYAGCIWRCTPWPGPSLAKPAQSHGSSERVSE